MQNTKTLYHGHLLPAAPISQAVQPVIILMRDVRLDSDLVFDAEVAGTLPCLSLCCAIQWPHCPCPD